MPVWLKERPAVNKIRKKTSNTGKAKFWTNAWLKFSWFMYFWYGQFIELKVQ